MAAIKARAGIETMVADGQAEDPESDLEYDKVDSDDASEYDSSVDDSDYDEADTRRTKSSKPAQHIEAEKTVARSLHLTDREFSDLRRSLNRLHQFILHFSLPMSDFLLRVLDASAPPSAALQDEEKIMLCQLANTLVSAIDLPYDNIAQTFVPLHEWNGGVFTTLSKSMRKVFGVAILIDLLGQFVDATVHGPTQRQNMEVVLRGLGLGADASVLLATSSSTQTVEQSVEESGKALVAKINALSEEARLRCCLAEVASVRIHGGQWLASSDAHRKVETCTVFFDNRHTRSTAHTMIADGSVQVAVNLVAFNMSALDQALESVHGSLYTVSKANYPYCGLPDVCTSSRTVVPFRASTVIAPPTRKGMVHAMESLLFDAHPTDAQKGKQMKQMLDAAFPSRHQYSFHLPPNTLVGACYNTGKGKRWLKMGKESASTRSASQSLSLGRKGRSGWHWLVLEEENTFKEVVDLLSPPWVGFQNGTVEIFVIPSVQDDDRDPSVQARFSKRLLKSALRLSTVRAHTAQIAMESAKNVATKAICYSGRKRARDLTEDELDRIGKAGTDAYGAARRLPIRIPFTASAFPDWHTKGRLATEARLRPTPENCALYEEAKKTQDHAIAVSMRTDQARRAAIGRCGA